MSWICAMHGKDTAEHVCLFCCLCFEDLTPEECFVDSEGVKWDMCKPCAKMEAEHAR